jgi:hypothetical protein
MLHSNYHVLNTDNLYAGCHDRRVRQRELLAHGAKRPKHFQLSNKHITNGL